MKYVEIDRHMPIFDQITLEYLLLKIKVFASLYVWSIQIIEGVGNIEKAVGMCMMDLEKHCNESEKGYITDVKSLIELSNSCEDIIEIVVVACKSEGDIPKAFKDKNWEEKCDVIISLEDSSLWQLVSKNDQIQEEFGSLVG